MNFQEMKDFYKNNPIASVFVVADFAANTACAWMMANFNSMLGCLFGVAGIAAAAALALSLPIIGKSAGESYGKNFIVIGMAWLAFTCVSVLMSYTTTFGRFEYARINAEKSTALSGIYKNIAETSSKTLDQCWGLKDCDSQKRMDTAALSAKKLSENDIKWTPHQMPNGDLIVKWLVGSFAIVSALGGSVMGFIFGLGSSSAQKKRYPREVAA